MEPFSINELGGLITVVAGAVASLTSKIILYRHTLLWHGVQARSWNVRALRNRSSGLVARARYCDGIDRVSHADLCQKVAASLLHREKLFFASRSAFRGKASDA